VNPWSKENAPQLALPTMRLTTKSDRLTAILKKPENKPTSS